MPSIEEIVAGIGDKVYTDGPRVIRGPVHLTPISEFNHAKMAEILGKGGKYGITIGFAGFVNLDWIRLASPEKGGILCDINAWQKPFWEAVFELIGECKTYQSFHSRFTVYEPDYNRKFDLRGGLT